MRGLRSLALLLPALMLAMALSVGTALADNGGRPFNLALSGANEFDRRGRAHQSARRRRPRQRHAHHQSWPGRGLLELWCDHADGGRCAPARGPHPPRGPRESPGPSRSTSSAARRRLRRRVRIRPERPACTVTATSSPRSCGTRARTTSTCTTSSTPPASCERSSARRSHLVRNVAGARRPATIRYGASTAFHLQLGPTSSCGSKRRRNRGPKKSCGSMVRR